MSNRSGRQSRYSQPTVSGFFNPEALDASQRLTSVSLDTICENVEQIKNLIENNQSEQAINFWHRVFMPQVNATRKQLNHTSYLERQQVQHQSQQNSASGTSSPMNSGRSSSKVSLSQLPSDPRELRQLQDTIQRKINQTERSGTSAGA